MAEQRTGKFCKLCGVQTMAVRPGTNHLLHLVLTLLTAGIWVFVWIGVAIQFGGWRCSKCGSKV